MEQGALVLSLDFELYWGVRDVVPLDAYRESLLGVRRAIPAILERFERREVHATWATVGFLMARDRDELLSHVPSELPTYDDPGLSPYPALDRIGRDEGEDPFHYAPSLLDAIAKTPSQEIGTHTFSHFYCLEPGQTQAQFRADMLAASAIGERYGPILRSFVVPRNQWNPGYTGVLRELGVRAVRVNREHPFYRASRLSEEPLWKRAGRLADAFVPLSGAGSERAPQSASIPAFMKASHFFRPYSRRLAPLYPLRRRRLRAAMEHAAREGHVLHLWWHPHNFGSHPVENLGMLDELLGDLDTMRRKHGMLSLSMGELADRVVTRDQTVSESQ